MYVFLIVEAGFIHRAPYEAVAYDEAKLYEKAHGVVEGGTRHAEVACFEFCAEVFDSKVPIHVIHCIEYGIAFRGLTILVYFQIVRKYLPYTLFLCFLGHTYRNLKITHKVT
jgi:hypothetical protein